MFRTIRQLWWIFDKETRSNAVILCALMAVSSVLEGFGVGIIFPLLKAVADPQGIQQVPLLSTLHRMLGQPSATDTIVVFSLGTLVVFVVKNIIGALVSRYQFRFVWYNRSRFAVQVFKYYLNSSYMFFLRNSPHILQRNATTSVDEIFGSVVLPSVQIASEVVVVVVVIGVLMAVDFVPTMAVLVLFVTSTVGFYMAVRRQLKIWGQEHENTNGEIISNVSQTIRAIKYIKTTGKEAFFARTFERCVTRNSMARQRYQFITILPRVVLETLAIAVMLLGVVGLLLMGRGPADVIATLGLFGIVAFRLMPSLNRITGYAANLRVGASTVETLHADISAIRANPAVMSAIHAVEEDPLPFTQSIQLINVGFRYPGRDEAVLHDINITVRKGGSVALVGSSGAGKTTLADVIMAVVDPACGQMLVDGVPIESGNVRRWQKNIGYVPQDVVLIEDSLARNIAFGRTDTEIDREQLRRAIGLAQLDTLVAKLPQGMDTPLGPNNALSGGERQRIGIARAIYSDPALIIMDEATSSLDAETEALVTRAIEALKGDKTVIIVAHRLSTVERCDTLYFMRDGMTVDSGTFQQLVETQPHFAKMVQLMGLQRADAGDTLVN